MWFFILCGVIVVQTLIVLAFALRLVPTLIAWAGTCLRWFLILSYRAYRLVLGPLGTALRAETGLDITLGWPRIVATCLLSLMLGLLIIALTPPEVSVVSVAVCLVHGLVVGIIWDEAEHGGNLHLGANVS